MMLRKYGGMSGFPKRKESECDAFDTGHSSTSISAGLGYVAARELSRGKLQRNFCDRRRLYDRRHGL